MDLLPLIFVIIKHMEKRLSFRQRKTLLRGVAYPGSGFQIPVSGKLPEEECQGEEKKKIKRGQKRKQGVISHEKDESGPLL